MPRLSRFNSIRHSPSFLFSMSLVPMPLPPIWHIGFQFGIPHLARDDGTQETHSVIHVFKIHEPRITILDELVTLNADITNRR
jgi:hypothetical protein